jgi:hypothetical protein
VFCIYRSRGQRLQMWLSLQLGVGQAIMVLCFFFGFVRARKALCSSNLPVHVCDADLLARLLVVVEPLAFIQLDAGELCACLGAGGQELALVEGALARKDGQSLGRGQSIRQP